MKSLSLVSALLLGSTVYAGSIPYEFPLVKTAKAADSQAEADLSVIRLDNEIYRNVDSYMTELRVVDANDREVPFTVQKYVRGKSSVDIKKYPALFKRLRQEANRTDIYIIPKNSLNVPVRVIELITAAKNFEKRITVAVHTGGKWQAVAQNFICDFSDYAPYRRDMVTFPAPVNGSLFRVIIDNITDARISPFNPVVAEITGGAKAKEYTAMLHRKELIKLDGINFVTAETSSIGLMDILADSKVEVAGIEQKGDRSIITLHTSRQPLTGFRLSTTSVNFSRHYILEGQSIVDAEPKTMQWQELAAGVVVSCNFNTIRKKALNVDFPESRFAVYRLTIINGSNPPLQNLAVEAGGPIYQLLMTGKQTNDLTVYYGPNRMPPPSYDTDALLAKLSSFNTRNYSLSAGQKNPYYLQKWYSGKIKYFLGLLFVLVAGGLGFFLFRTMRKTDVANETPPENPEVK